MGLLPHFGNESYRRRNSRAKESCSIAFNQTL